MSGAAVVRSYSAFSVNDALLAKVVEATMQGEKDARRYGQIRSFEIFYHGHRQNLVLGRIMLIPAKVADSIEDFPSALLYGTIVKELNTEDIADVYNYKIGDDGYDTYEGKDLGAIKERLFKDSDNNFRTLVMFIPTWANPRDHVVFKFVRDEEKLTMLIRHLIYGVYFDPRLSSGFEALTTELATEKMSVTDITPKLNFPFLAESLEKYYPELEPGDGSKTASKKRIAKMVVSAENMKQWETDELLEPGEKAVIDELTEEMIAAVTGEISEPEETIKQAGIHPEVREAWVMMYGGKRLPVLKQEEATLQAYLNKINGRGNEKLMRAKQAELEYVRGLISEMEGTKWATKQAGTAPTSGSAPDSGESSLGLSGLPELAESVPEALAAIASKKKADGELIPNLDVAMAATPMPEASTLGMQASDKTAKLVVTVAPVLGGFNWRIIDRRILKEPKIITGGHAKTFEEAEQAGNAKLMELTTKVKPAVQAPPASYNPGPSRVAKAAVVLLHGGGDGGTVLIRAGNKFAAKTARYSEVIRINGTKIKWIQPNQFSPDFRKAAELYIRNPRNKIADVPLTLETIWADVTEDFGPAPEVEVGGTDTGRSPETTPSDSGGSAAAPKKDEWVKPWEQEEEKEETPERTQNEVKRTPNENKPESKPKAESKPKVDNSSSEQTKPSSPEPKAEESSSAEPKKEAPKPFEKKEGAKTASAKNTVGPWKVGIGSCQLCKKAVLSSTGSEVGPDVFVHAACQDKAIKAANLNFIPRQVVAAFYPSLLKTAAFNMFIPGQVAEEFAPEELQESIDHPNQGNSPMIADVGPQPDGAYVSTSPAGGIGIGRDGKPQVLDGAPLRKENDIRGYGFSDEFYNQYEGISPQGLHAASALASVRKKADVAEWGAQFADFLKKAMGEIAASFIAGFKVTSRPLMNEVPGTGEIELKNIEQPSGTAYNLVHVASRVQYLVSKLNDSDIQEAINASWAQASVHNDSPEGGYVYEVFVRPESLDQDTLVLRYSFVVGTKGL